MAPGTSWRSPAATLQDGTKRGAAHVTRITADAAAMRRAAGNRRHSALQRACYRAEGRMQHAHSPSRGTAGRGSGPSRTPMPWSCRCPLDCAALSIRWVRWNFADERRRRVCASAAPFPTKQMWIWGLEEVRVGACQKFASHIFCVVLNRHWVSLPTDCSHGW